MRIETLPGDPGRRQKRMRVGRGEGSGKGKTCGRGTKGYQARTGSTRRIGDEGGQMRLIQRLPKRGFTSLERVRFCLVNVGQLARFEAGTEVGPEALWAARVVRKRGGNVRVKILAQGELNQPLTVRAHAFSAAARQKITAAGGRCETIGETPAVRGGRQQKG